MDSDRWNQVERLFVGAAKLPAGKRAGFLARECGGDAALQREVISLLAHDAESDGSLTAEVGEQIARTVASVSASTAAGRRIGPYRIERELGHGGMGVVFLAIRDDHTFKKSVAIKLLRFAFEREGVVRRFINERQILAALDHQNIARLLDGGTTDDGEPYVVMEYVKGRSIDVYCNENQLDVEQRLELFCQVCDAVQYAHSNLVVHRDIKPGNILVTREGVPKLLDFGIAKLLDPESLPEIIEPAGTSTRWMTPEYASPEQVRGEPITIATDVYALGVLLYKLLTGQSPYQPDGTGRLALERAVCEQDPARPSAVASRNLRRRLAGDLDNIVLMALRKEPSQRYPTVETLGADARRHLDGLPVAARRATLTYRLGRYVRRKPVHTALMVALLIGVPTLAGLIVQSARQQMVLRESQIEKLLEQTRWWEDRRRYAQVLDRARVVLDLDPDNVAARRHRALAGSRLVGLLRAGVPMSHTDAATLDPEALERSALDDTGRLIAAASRASWPHALHAQVLRNLGRDDDARLAQARADEMSGATLSDDEIEFAARLKFEQGAYQRAIELFSDLILRRPDRSSAISTRAAAYEQLGDVEFAFAEYRIAAGVNPLADLAFVDLARLSVDRGALDDAQTYLDRAFEIRADGENAYETLGSLLAQRGLRTLGRGKTDAALELLRRSDDASRRALELNPDMPFAEANLAATLLMRSRLSDEPGPLREQAIAHYDKLLAPWPTVPAGRDDRRLFEIALGNSCDALIQLRRLADALITCERMTTAFPEQAVGFYNLAAVYALLDRSDESLAALERDLELGDTDWQYLQQDDWFASLRDDPGFVNLVKRMRETASS